MRTRPKHFKLLGAATCCYGAGWLARIKPANAADVDKLMDAEAYRASLG